MNSAEFIIKATQHSDKLCDLIRNWHPRSSDFVLHAAEDSTAPGPQEACNILCRSIQKEAPAGALPPVEAFRAALEAKDAVQAYTILAETWIGVPEVTSFREFTGAQEALDLLDDPPDDFPDFDDDGKPIPGTERTAPNLKGQ